MNDLTTKHWFFKRVTQKHRDWVCFLSVTERGRRGEGAFFLPQLLLFQQPSTSVTGYLVHSGEDLSVIWIHILLIIRILFHVCVCVAQRFGIACCKSLIHCQTAERTTLLFRIIFHPFTKRFCEWRVCKKTVNLFQKRCTRLNQTIQRADGDKITQSIQK